MQSMDFHTVSVSSLAPYPAGTAGAGWMPDELVRPADQRFVEYLHTYAGSSLRGIVRYTDEECEVLYARDDVAALYENEAGLGEVTDILRATEAAEERQAELLRAGDHEVTVRLYEDAVVLHFPRSTGAGTVVALDPEVAGNLRSFLDGCLEYLPESG